MDKIRLLHFADLHIGTEKYGRLDATTGVNQRVLDFLARFDELIDYAERNEADLVIFAGDAFKTRSPNPTYQRAFARRIKQLANQGIAVVLLVGNHDLPAMAQQASSVDIFHILEVPNVIVGRDERVHRIQTRRGPVQVASVPYPLRQRLLGSEEFRGLSVLDLDRKLQEKASEMVGLLRGQVGPDAPAVLTAHLSVSGATYGSERSVMIGRDAVILKSALADPAWDYVALGHIHQHQSINAGAYPAVVYSGSLERIDFGEEGQAKGFCWVELARGATEWRAVELKARPFVTVRADLRQALNPLLALQEAIAKHDLTDAVVRLMLRLSAEQEALLRDREIRALLPQAHYVDSITRDVDRQARLRLGSLSPEEMSDQDLLARYLLDRSVPPERAQVLLEHAQAVMNPPEGA
jgi:DNA repair protein SbcD/Mre11